MDKDKKFIRFNCVRFENIKKNSKNCHLLPKDK